MTPLTIEQANLNAKLPTALGSVLAETLARLLMGQALSQKDATELMSTTRLSGFIYTLRHDYGWDIQTLTESSPTNDGRISHYARYILPADEIVKLSEQERVSYALSVFTARRERKERKGKVLA